MNDGETGLAISSVDLIPVHNDYAEQNGSDAHWIAVKNIVISAIKPITSEDAKTDAV